MPDAEMDLVVATEDHPPSGLEGGIRASVLNVDGCLGVESDDQLGVLYLPFDTKRLSNGAKLPDGTEFILGMEDVFVGGMWVGHEDPLYPDMDTECMGATVFYVFTP
ncbi:hypothetical protein ACQBAT_13170 [Ornithinimicrobium sp. Y1847]|uniref:hypothetical protein n=1 Tax=Ornithinimicrobium sp. Y1847 TaxID=3405419 RepID=UPI003B67842E